jgi:putative copper resistance protein D
LCEKPDGLAAGERGGITETVPLSVGRAVSTWQFAPLVSGLLILLAVCYLAGTWRVAIQHPARPWPAARTLAFLLGLGVIALATESSIGAYDDVLFSVHMVQHLLLIMVAPPLLVAGRPVTLLLHASQNPLHGWVVRIARSRVVTAATWPPFTVALYASVVVATHLTPFMNLVLENDAVHNAEHAVYLVVGYLYFLPVVGSEPVRPRVSPIGRCLLLLITMPVDTAVGVILMLAPHELFSAYTRVGRDWGPGLVTDLHLGGFIMFAGSDLIMTVLGIALAVSLVRQPRAFGLAEGTAALRAYNAALGRLDQSGGGH